MIDPTQVKVGMPVRDLEGTKLGKVTSFDTGVIKVEKKSIFGDREYVLRYTDVETQQRDELLLCVTEGDLRARLAIAPNVAADDAERIGVERDVMRTGEMGATTYVEHSIRVAPEGGQVFERDVIRELPGRRERDETTVASSPEVTARQREIDLDEDRDDDVGRAPDAPDADGLAAAGEHP